MLIILNMSNWKKKNKNNSSKVVGQTEIYNAELCTKRLWKKGTKMELGREIVKPKSKGRK